MHGQDLDARRTICNVLIEGSAVVLGSSQHSSSQHSSSHDIGASAFLDLLACENAGVEIVKRRSGGGLVYLAPEQHIWIDVVIAREDILWTDDVGESAQWLGDAWCRALETLGHRDLRVHREATAQTQLGRLICFAGAGAGEVFSGNHKLVGISQRRTSKLARFQCTIYRAWQPQQLLNLLSNEARDVVTMNGGSAVLSDLVATTSHEAETVMAALVDQLQTL
jgi:lipoate-protein ligase A